MTSPLQVLEAAGQGAHRAELAPLIADAVWIVAKPQAPRPGDDAEAIALMEAAMAELPGASGVSRALAAALTPRR